MHQWQAIVELPVPRQCLAEARVERGLAHMPRSSRFTDDRHDVHAEHGKQRGKGTGAAKPAVSLSGGASGGHGASPAITSSNNGPRGPYQVHGATHLKPAQHSEKGSHGDGRGDGGEFYTIGGAHVMQLQSRAR
eukprot:SAG22_NODE_2278_length_2761_cov_37.860255_2_plen_134_part_00